MPAYAGLTAVDSSTAGGEVVDVTELTIEEVAPVDITPPTVVDMTPPPAVERPPVTTPTPLPVDDYVTILTKNKTEGTVAMKSAIASVEQYLLGMKPGKTIPPTSGALIQYLFWKALLSIINQTTPAEFKDVWTMVIAIVTEHRAGAFMPKYTARFSAEWKWGSASLSTYMRLIHLMVHTADPTKTRADVLKDIDLDKVMDDYFTSQGRDNLHTYYSRYTT